MKCLFCDKDFLKTNNRHKFCSVVCKKTAQKEKYSFSSRKSNIRYKYGLSWDEWLSLYNEQEGRCKICFKFCPIHPESKGDGLAVDHCHTTGEVRSLLCIPCNSAIGQLKEDPEIIQKALEYVQYYSKRERKKR